MKSFTAQTDVPAKTIVPLHCMKFDNNNNKKMNLENMHISFSYVNLIIHRADNCWIANMITCCDTNL